MVACEPLHTAELGYVERRPDPVDGRAKRIHLTEKGRRSNQAAWTVIQEVNRSLDELLGDDESETLRRVLSTIADAEAV